MTNPLNQPDPPLPGKGLLGWLGRQVAHIKNAFQTDINAAKTIYRNQKVEEKPLPQDPNIKLRRTTIDEVVVDQPRPTTPPRKNS
jgi:hypothetical protein